ncbi:hypothetical protein Cgig2_008557 [Carnegiea gigantea]|uniref:Reverse transcriptase domain-containing protein n=1 Tax=Carnegiea gigantea TaxID=171969 RepID=A0A9Q1GX89_9CARY|nr:hypothetical protein Cgig2_008557 [Carnegiea gigantea]
MDTLKSLMSTMAETILHQVAEQVKKAMDTAGLAQPVAVGGPPIGRKAGRPFASWNMAERRDVQRRSLLPDPHKEKLQSRQLPPLPMRHTLGGPHGLKNMNRLLGRGERTQAGDAPVRGHPMLHQPPPITAPPKPQNARKYCEFHEQSRHTTTECRELKKALHELANKGQIDRFLKKGPLFLRQEQAPAPPPPREEECSTKVMATIVGGYREEITWMVWKA